MAKTKCHIYYHCQSLHMDQIYTGLSILHNAKLIDLTQSFWDQKEIRQKKFGFPDLSPLKIQWMLLIINNKLKVLYDTSDGALIDTKILKNVDYYFKRIYEEEWIKENISEPEEQKKINPLGFNYGVFPNFRFDKYKIERDFKFAQKGPLGVLKYIGSIYFPSRFRPKVKQLEQRPNTKNSPKILFMVRAWDPYNDPNMDPFHVNQRNEINETRAECISLLRDKYKSQFYGGFIHTDYAKKKYRDLLLSDNDLSDKKKYLLLLRAHPICIATTGLHGSVGWKMGEYIAHSKGIISEKFSVKVPGNFEEGKNYLSFDTPEDLQKTIDTLLVDQLLLSKIMENNHIYYNNYLRPDRLVLNTIETVLNKKIIGNT